MLNKPDDDDDTNDGASSVENEFSYVCMRCAE